MAASIRRNKDSCGSHTENCADRSWNLEDQGHDDREEPPKPARERHTTKSAREAHGRLGIVRPAPNGFRGTTIQWEPRTGTSSRLVVLRLIVGCPGLRFGLIVFDRLLDDLPLDERLGRDRFADDPARDGVRHGNSRRSSGSGSGGGLRARKSLPGGRGARPVGGRPPGPGGAPPPPPPPPGGAR